ncbi:MAG: APC family permease [Pseudoflavonifractor sp.]|nr:APC family permease [Pseudoflavonifractor sp.]
MNQDSVKKIGLWNIVGLGVGGAVGSGIFVTLGSAIAQTGRSILPITVICVFYMLLAYWYNLAMSGIFVVEGGDYSMKGMLLPPLLTGYGGWTNVIWAFGFTGYAMALTSYLSSLWPVLADHSKLSSAILLTAFFLLTIRGNRIVTLFQNVATVLLVAALILFVVMGVSNVNTANFFSATYDGGFFHGGFVGIISAIAIMGWACQGTTMGPVGVIAITKNPKRTVPIGIIVTCVVVSIVYGIMSFVAAGVLPYEQIAGQNLSVSANAFMSHGPFAFFIIGGGVCAIISSFLAVLAMIREPLSHMADDGWLPAVFRKKSKDGYPYVCFLLVYIIALLPILTGMSVDNAITMLMIPTMLINAYLNVACMAIPKKYPEQFAKRAVRFPLWLYNTCSILGGFCATVIAITLFQDLTPQNAILAACIVIVPLIFSALALKKKSVDAKVLNEKKNQIINAALTADSHT